MAMDFRVFVVREVSIPDYVVPTVDVRADGANGDIFDVPGAPVVVEVTVGSLKWLRVVSALGYVVERLTNGTIFENIANITVDGTEPVVLSFVLNSEEIVGQAFYRVIAYNEVGNGSPSHALFLALEEPDESGGSSS